VLRNLDAAGRGRTAGASAPKGQNVHMPSRASIWVALFIGSTIGATIPEVLGAEMLS
jgi:hypothetical protein